jgi:hypothetical protein
VLTNLPADTSLTNGVNITSANLVQVTGTDGLKLTLTSATGLLSGTFQFPGTSASTPVKGVVLQEQGEAAGYWLDNNNQSGAFLINSQ